MTDPTDLTPDFPDDWAYKAAFESPIGNEKVLSLGQRLEEFAFNDAEFKEGNQTLGLGDAQTNNVVDIDSEGDFSIGFGSSTTRITGDSTKIEFYVGGVLKHRMT